MNMSVLIVARLHLQNGVKVHMVQKRKLFYYHGNICILTLLLAYVMHVVFAGQKKIKRKNLSEKALNNNKITYN